MKNKKFLCLVLALVMVLGAFGPVFAETKAADDAKKVEDKKVEDKKVEVKKVTGRDNKIQYLIDNKYVEGRKVNEDPKNNDLALDKTIKRSEITKLLVYAIGRQDLAEKVQGVEIYSDVAANYWANGVITVGTTMASPANNVAFLNGYPDGSFKPENDVTYGELAKMLVTLVKKDLTKEMHDKANKPGVWPAQWITWAAELGILEDVKIEDANKPAVRSDAFVMLYNALYAMKYIKKTASTDEIGVLSQLKNKKLTLNQGDKKKEYTITDDTTFILYDRRDLTTDVNARDKGNLTYTKVVKVAALDNPVYFYGSLMRVITDKNGNLTHVLELGNPRDLALGNGDLSWNIKDNTRWKDVADATAETTKFVELKGRSANDSRYGGKLAKFEYVSDHHLPKEIAIYNAQVTHKPENSNEDWDPNNYAVSEGPSVFSAKLNKNTRYFVADVEKNQLTELDNLEEAILTVGGTRNSNWFSEVYVGYDVVKGADDHETSAPTAINGYNVAKVVVFNHVKKDNNNAQLLRVKNEATTLYDATLEKTDGTEVVFNVEKYRAAFPFNYDDEKFNVIEITENAADGIVIVPKIEQTQKYPVVKVIQDDGNSIVVEDANKDTARLYLADGYDKFLEGQKLLGKNIQFRTLAGNVVVDKDGNALSQNITNYVEIVSIVDSAVRDTLQGKVLYNLDNRKVGYLRADNIKVSVDNEKIYNVKIDVENKFYGGGQGSKLRPFHVDATTAKQLLRYFETNKLEGAKVRFLETTHWDKTNEAYDFEVRPLENKPWMKIEVWVAAKDVEAKLLSLPDTIDTEEKAKLVDAAAAAFDELSDAQKEVVSQAAKDKLTAKKAEAAAFRAKVAKQKAYDDFVASLETNFNNLSEDQRKSHRVVQAELEKQVKELVEGLEGFNPNWKVTANSTTGDVVLGPNNKVEVTIDANDSDVTNNTTPVEVVITGV